jgi:2-haloacid dehalogenase
MNKHIDFWSITQDGLDWALEANNLSDDVDLRKELLKLYFNLTAYPEVSQMLSDLRSNHILTGILSNGSPDMLNGAVQSAGISDLLNEVISVEDVGVFKPDISIYELVEKRFGCEIREVLFVSSNCWDACAAASFGFQTGWVNRSNDPTDRLPSGNLVIMKDLSDIATLVV